jgi:DnaJ family protein B protein 12
MEANKDSALHYLELAERAIVTHDIERAIRYINKSEDLFPTKKAKDLLERIKSSTFQSTNDNKSNESTSTSSNSKHTTTNDTSSHPRHRTTSASNGDYTSEEVEAVRKIKTCKDLYEILGVSKTASEADLKKAYRKLALQFHPDKCKAPGATDAFKAIGKAFSILSDPKKREQYDQYGQAMEPQYHRGNMGGGRGGYYYYCDEDDDFSAEEIFNIFFGHAGATNRAYRRRQQPNSHHFTTHTPQNSTHTLAQLLPYLFLFLISIIGTLLVSDPQFQLHPTGKYTIHRTTRTLNIDYYVKRDFHVPQTDAELETLESSVTDEYISDLRHKCHREQQYKESMLWRARMMNDNQLYRQAQQQKTPSCTKLNDLIRGYA